MKYEDVGQHTILVFGIFCARVLLLVSVYRIKEMPHELIAHLREHDNNNMIQAKKMNKEAV